MNTTFTVKLAALALALVINTAIMGSVALAFNGRMQPALVAGIVDHTIGAIGA